MKAFMALIALVAGANMAHASTDDYQTGLKTVYYATCKNEIPSEMNDKDKAELKEGAESIRAFLASPEETAKKILAESSKKDFGPFPLLMTCALITSLEDQLKAEGCRDLNGTQVDATAGIELCKQIIAKAQK